MRTTNNFLVVPRIIFNTSIENYFFIVLIIIFRCIANLFLGLQCFAGLAVKADWFESLTSLGNHFENFEVEECFQRECQGEKLSGKETKGVFIFLTKSVRSQQSVRSWWGFLDRRFNRGDYEATSRLVHNSNPYWTWHVCPIEQFSAQSYTSSLRLVLHMLAFGTKMLWMRVPLTLNFRILSWRAGIRTRRAKWIRGRRSAQNASQSRPH